MVEGDDDGNLAVVRFFNGERWLKQEVPTKVSQLENDAGYISASSSTYKTYDDTKVSLEADGFVHLLPSDITPSSDGEMWRTTSDGAYNIYQSGQTYKLGGLLPNDIDATLTIPNKAADAYAAGQAISDVNLQVQDIDALIPAQATTSNKLADKAFVNSSVQTATANFRGNWETWYSLPADVSGYPADYTGSRTPTVNDYMVVQDASGYDGSAGVTLSGTWRFKYSGIYADVGVLGWIPEYQVNETPMTAAQLAAINSGITAQLVSQIGDVSYSFVTPQDPNDFDLADRTNTQVTANSEPMEVGLPYGSTGKMRDMWLTVLVPSSVTTPSIVWYGTVKAKDGDATNLELQPNAYNTFMIAEKRPNVFMVAREVEELE